MKTETLDGSSAFLEVSNEETGGIPRRDSMKNKEIRNYILGQDEDHMCVRIKRNGEIHVRTKKPPGDGGRTPWTMFYGWRNDVVREIGGVMEKEEACAE
jgi:hypothetical protein